MSLTDRRTMELATVVAIAFFGGVIVAGSLQLDTGWAAETGPQSGYLPLRLGIALCAVSVLLFLGILRQPGQAVFVTREQFKLTLAVFLPTAVLVGSMSYLGCYAPSWVYLLYMVKVQGRNSWGKSLLLASIIIIAFYLVFDLWFKVDLAKGPVESFLGL
ncbi:tripartite tricarboxylate transporter TctB family protein [Pusillimonas sp. ANT_WB101]|uniref:tripartite tricarboxylate transporter TctB family protein n=1 Tax=Pusillimonas sp. ANT_WB101 TaxID=2597356 RepID=UPI0011EDDA8A|nr:tripartite tricarboxylate transporter TctB family protein [Pusillimonas sp. ANT_WB101]KAA0892882.1 tripartite tricarboxylate transporter TctB family protein [Pusillimonas sp. ANT_WB101]